MTKKLLFAIGLLAISATAITNASASTILYTDWQSSSYHYDNQGVDPISPTTNLLFNGFNSNLGTLTSVSIYLSAVQFFDNTVFNANSGARGVLNVSATSTTSITGPLGLSASFTLATNPYTGPVPGLGAVTVVGAATFNGVTSTSTLSQPTNLSSYIGGINAITIALAYTDSTSGTVPGGAFISNNTDLDVTAFLRYGYTQIPEPTDFMLLGIGLVAIASFSRKKAIVKVA